MNPPWELCMSPSWRLRKSQLKTSVLRPLGWQGADREGREMLKALWSEKDCTQQEWGLLVNPAWLWTDCCGPRAAKGPQFSLKNCRKTRGKDTHPLPDRHLEVGERHIWLQTSWRNPKELQEKVVLQENWQSKVDRMKEFTGLPWLWSPFWTLQVKSHYKDMWKAGSLLCTGWAGE